MDDRRRAAVQVVEDVGGVAQQPHHLAFAQRGAALVQGAEALALDLLHHQIERAVLLERVTGGELGEGGELALAGGDRLVAHLQKQRRQQATRHDDIGKRQQHAAPC